MAGSRIFAVGDIHGCVDELEALLDRIAPGVGDTICFLGDYVDRGRSPRGVIDRLIRLRGEGPQCVFLRGNHEDMFLSYLGLPGAYGNWFLENGGGATLADYGAWQVPRSQALARMPSTHIDFLNSLVPFFAVPGYLFVHAGLDPQRPLNAQQSEDLFWIREPFIDSSHEFGVTVLYGHTPYRDIAVDLPYKVGLDTGAVYGNRLSCLEITEGHLTQIDSRTYGVRERSVPLHERRNAFRIHRPLG